MPQIATSDGVRLYYRTWEPQMRFFSRAHRCITYSQRGYPPSDIPEDPARYSQDIAVNDAIALMDALGIGRAHVVGHSMGALTALLVGIRHPERCISVVAAGCGYGSSPDPRSRRWRRAMPMAPRARRTSTRTRAASRSSRGCLVSIRRRATR